MKMKSVLLSLVEDYASDRVRHMNKIESDLRFQSMWQQLMQLSSLISVDDVRSKMKQLGVTSDDAQQIIDRLNAAPGDNLKVRAAAELMLKGQ